MMELRALTIREPWAWAISEGHKLVENRTWSTAYRGLLAIHSAKAKPTRDDVWHVRILADARPGVPASHLSYILQRSMAQRGHIVALCRLLDSLAPGSVDGGVHRPLRPREVDLGKRLEEPIPVTGRLGLWRPDAELTARLRDLAR